jgi:hypothetical protein
VLGQVLPSVSVASVALAIHRLGQHHQPVPQLAIRERGRVATQLELAMVIAQLMPHAHDRAWTFGEVPVVGCTPVVAPQQGHGSMSVVPVSIVDRSSSVTGRPSDSGWWIGSPSSSPPRDRQGQRAAQGARRGPPVPRLRHPVSAGA